MLVGRWLASRHKSLDLSFGLLPMTMRDAFAGYTHSPAKALGVSHDELLATLYADFSIHQCQVGTSAAATTATSSAATFAAAAASRRRRC